MHIEGKAYVGLINKKSIQMLRLQNVVTTPSLRFNACV